MVNFTHSHTPPIPMMQENSVPQGIVPHGDGVHVPLCEKPKLKSFTILCATQGTMFRLHGGGCTIKGGISGCTGHPSTLDRHPKEASCSRL